MTSTVQRCLTHDMMAIVDGGLGGEEIVGCGGDHGCLLPSAVPYIAPPVTLPAPGDIAIYSSPTGARRVLVTSVTDVVTGHPVVMDWSTRTPIVNYDATVSVDISLLA